MIKVETRNLLDISMMLNDSPVWFRWNEEIFPGKLFGLVMKREQAMKISWTSAEIYGEGVACLRLKNIQDLNSIDEASVCLDRGASYSILTALQGEAWFRMSNWDKESPTGETHQFWKGFDLEFIGRHPEMSQDLPFKTSRGLIDLESLKTLRGFLEDRVQSLEDRVLLNLRTQQISFQELQIKIRVKACQNKHESCSVLVHDLLALMEDQEFRTDLFSFSILSQEERAGTLSLNFPNLALIMPIRF